MNESATHRDTWRPASPGDTPGQLTPEHGPSQPIDLATAGLRAELERTRALLNSARAVGSEEIANHAETRTELAQVHADYDESETRLAAANRVVTAARDWAEERGPWILDDPGRRADAIDLALLDAVHAHDAAQPAEPTPTPAESRTEWGVRLRWDTGLVEDVPRDNRDQAERTVALHTRSRTEQPGWRVTAELIQRTITTGPWRPAETAQGRGGTLAHLTRESIDLGTYDMPAPTYGDRCADTAPHRPHEHYGQPAAIRRDCPGVPAGPRIAPECSTSVRRVHGSCDGCDCACHQPAPAGRFGGNT